MALSAGVHFGFDGVQICSPEKNSSEEQGKVVWRGVGRAYTTSFAGEIGIKPNSSKL